MSTKDDALIDEMLDEYWHATGAADDVDLRPIRVGLCAALVVARKAILEEAALAAEGFGQNRDWVPGSLYETLRREVAGTIRSLATQEQHND